MKKGRGCVTPEHSSSENLRGTSSKATVAYSIYIINIVDNSEEPIVLPSKEHGVFIFSDVRSMAETELTGEWCVHSRFVGKVILG